MLREIEGLSVGDKIFYFGVLNIKHYGIFIGGHEGLEDCVIHNDKDGGVAIDTLWGFTQDRQLYLDGFAYPPEKAWFVVERALQLVGKCYDLLFFNCEHFVRVAYGEVPESKQVQGFVAILGVTFLGAALLKNSPKYDSSIDRYRDSYGRFMTG